MSKQPAVQQQNYEDDQFQFIDINDIDKQKIDPTGGLKDVLGEQNQNRSSPVKESNVHIQLAQSNLNDSTAILGKQTQQTIRQNNPSQNALRQIQTRISDQPEQLSQDQSNGKIKDMHKLQDLSLKSRLISKIKQEPLRLQIPDIDDNKQTQAIQDPATSIHSSRAQSLDEFVNFSQLMKSPSKFKENHQSQLGLKQSAHQGNIPQVRFVKTTSIVYEKTQHKKQQPDLIVDHKNVQIRSAKEQNSQNIFKKLLIVSDTTQKTQQKQQQRTGETEKQLERQNQRQEVKEKQKQNTLQRPFLRDQQKEQPKGQPKKVLNEKQEQNQIQKQEHKKIIQLKQSDSSQKIQNQTPVQQGSRVLHKRLQRINANQGQKALKPKVQHFDGKIHTENSQNTKNPAQSMQLSGTMSFDQEKLLLRSDTKRLTIHEDHLGTSYLSRKIDSPLKQLKDDLNMKVVESRTYEFEQLNLAKNSSQIISLENKSFLNNGLLANILPSVQQKIKEKMERSSKPPSIKCSIIEISDLQPKLQQITSMIRKYTSSTNQEWKCAKLKHNDVSQSCVNILRYYGHSRVQILNKDQSKQVSQKKNDRSKLFGLKSLQKRQASKQEENQRLLSQAIKLYLYVEPNLFPITRQSTRLKNIQQNKEIRSINFIQNFTFNSRLRIAVNLLQNISIIHNSGQMIFPSSLFPSSSQKSLLFGHYSQQSDSRQKKPQLRIGVHFIQSYKVYEGNSRNQFRLKQFIKQILKIQQPKQKQMDKQIKEETLIDKKADNTQKNMDALIPEPILTEIKSPQIRFYSDKWFWEALNANIRKYVQLSKEESHRQNLVNPLWIDHFEIPFACLKIIFGGDIVDKLIDLKYEELSKGVQKILKQKIKKDQSIKKDQLVNKDQSKKNDLKQASTLRSDQKNQQKKPSTSVLANISPQEQILKLCNKPLFQWALFQKQYKLQLQKVSKNSPTNPNPNKQKPKSYFEQNLSISNPLSKQTFQIISSCLSVLPFYDKGDDKFQSKRVSSLSHVYEKLKVLLVSEKQKPMYIPLFKVKDQLKSQKQQQILSNNQLIPKKQGIKDSLHEAKYLSILSSPNTIDTLEQLKKRYQKIKQASYPSRQEFIQFYVRNLQRQLLTAQTKKKLTAVFLSHTGIMKSPKSFNLLYKASVYNFTSQKYYKFCERKEKLLYVLKIKDDKTIYYYIQEKVQRNKQLNGIFGNYIKDTKGTSFIYSGQEILNVKNAVKAFGISFIYGPVMGDGDIIIKQGNIDNECNHPRSYEASKKNKKLLKSNKFVLDQMDIYQLAF